MQATLDAVLSSYQDTVEQLLTTLSNAPSEGRGTALSLSSGRSSSGGTSALSSNGGAASEAVRKLIAVDRRLRGGIAQLRRHQEGVRATNELEGKAVAIESALRESAQRIIGAEQQFSDSISRAKKLLQHQESMKMLQSEDGKGPGDQSSSSSSSSSSLSSSSQVTPEAVVRYSFLLSQSTSAPPDWRDWNPLDACPNVLQPMPLPPPERYFRSSVDPSGFCAVPSMVRVNWDKKKVENEPMPSEQQARQQEQQQQQQQQKQQKQELSRKRKASVESSSASLPAAKKPARQMIVGLEDDDSSEDEGE